MTIKSVICNLGPDRITEGFYTIEGRELTMVHPDGKQVMILDRPVTCTLKDGDREQAIARVLTRQIRKHFRGDQVEGFGEPIKYPVAGVA